jgi:hypothetical protein
MYKKKMARDIWPIWYKFSRLSKINDNNHISETKSNKVFFVEYTCGPSNEKQWVIGNFSGPTCVNFDPLILSHPKLASQEFLFHKILIL